MTTTPTTDGARTTRSERAITAHQDYRRGGYHTLPVRLEKFVDDRGEEKKRPRFPGDSWTTALATDPAQAAKEGFLDLAIVNSNVACLDFDKRPDESPEGVETRMRVAVTEFRLGDAMIERTGNGFHVFGRVPPANGAEGWVRNTKPPGEIEEVRVDTTGNTAGLMTFVAPSFHPVTETSYERLTALHPVEALPVLPVELLKAKGQPAAGRTPTPRAASGNGVYRGDFATLDVVALFREAGLYGKHMGGNKHGVTCPWASDHTTGSDGTDTAVWTVGADTQVPGFKCQHEHCAHRTMADVREFFGPEAVDRHCSSDFKPRDCGESTDAGTLAPSIVEETLGAIDGGSDIDSVGAALKAYADAARHLPPINRELARSTAIKTLKARNVCDSRRLTDAALRDAKVSGTDDTAHPTSGGIVALEDVDPWPDPVDGEELLDEVLTAIMNHIAIGEHAALAVTLWIMFSHAHDCFEVSPLLGLTSPEKRCGKTRTLMLISSMVPRPLPAANITAAALFRAVERFRPTLLVDEADTFLREREELRGILNSGHHKPGAVVVRTVGENFEARTFSTWAPKAVAAIGTLPSTIEDRSIIIRMRRRRPDEPVGTLRLDRLGGFETLRRKAARWVADHSVQLRDLDPADMPVGLDDRAADNWRPLVAIADLAGPWSARKARQAAERLSGNEDGDSTPAIQLLADIRDLFRINGTTRLSSAAIAESLAEREERSWPERKGGKPITPRQIARLLSRFDVKPQVIRTGEGTPRGYLFDQFTDAFARYLPFDPQHPQQSSNDAGKHGFSKCNTHPPVADVKTAETPVKPGVVADVADPTPTGRGARSVKASQEDHRL